VLGAIAREGAVGRWCWQSGPAPIDPRYAFNGSGASGLRCRSVRHCRLPVVLLPLFLSSPSSPPCFSLWPYSGGLRTGIHRPWCQETPIRFTRASFLGQWTRRDALALTYEGTAAPEPPIRGVQTWPAHRIRRPRANAANGGRYLDSPGSLDVARRPIGRRTDDRGTGKRGQADRARKEEGRRYMGI
jgi:hypothetical protein